MKMIGLVAGLLLSASLVFAGEGRTGIYASGGAGLQFGSTEGSNKATDFLEALGMDDASVESKGLQGFAFDLKLGYSIIPNLAVYGIGAVSTDATMTDENISFLYLGGGASYWFPMDIFVGGSIGAGRFNYENDFFTDDFGFSFRISAGKDWTIGSRGGIGVELYYQHAATEDDYSEWTGNMVGLKCNVSYR